MVRIFIVLSLGLSLFVSNSAYALTLAPICYLENLFSQVTPNLDCMDAYFQRADFGCDSDYGPTFVIENGCDSEILIVLEPTHDQTTELDISEFGYALGVGDTVVVVARLSDDVSDWEPGEYSWTYPVQKDGTDYELRIGFTLPVPEPVTASGGCQQGGTSSAVLWFLCLFGFMTRRLSSHL